MYCRALHLCINEAAGQFLTFWRNKNDTGFVYSKQKRTKAIEEQANEGGIKCVIFL